VTGIEVDNPAVVLTRGTGEGDIPEVPARNGCHLLNLLVRRLPDFQAIDLHVANDPIRDVLVNTSYKARNPFDLFTVDHAGDIDGRDREADTSRVDLSDMLQTPLVRPAGIPFMEPVIKGFNRHGHMGNTIKVREYIAVGNQSHLAADGLSQGCGQPVKGWAWSRLSTEDRHTPRTHRTDEREDPVEIEAFNPFELNFSVNLLPVAAEAAEIAANEIEGTGTGLRIVGDAVNIHVRTSIRMVS